MDTVRSLSPLNPETFSASIFIQQFESIIMDKQITETEIQDAIRKSFLPSLPNASTGCKHSIRDVIASLPLMTISRPVPLNALKTTGQKLEAIRYNHINPGPATFFTVHKHHSYKLLNFLALDMIKEAVPIRCLEAAVLAMRKLIEIHSLLSDLTNELTNVTRFVLSFKSEANLVTYRHIVLVVRTRKMFGALGLSRRSTLMYKPLVYQSLYELIEEYKQQYALLNHNLLKVKLGYTISHDPHDINKIVWKYAKVQMNDAARFQVINAFQKDINSTLV